MLDFFKVVKRGRERKKREKEEREKRGGEREGEKRGGERAKQRNREIEKKRKKEGTLNSPELVLWLAVRDLVVAEPDADALELAREDARVFHSSFFEAKQGGRGE